MSSLTKTLHVLGACLFIGNIVVSALWKTMADRTHDIQVARFATRLVNLTDGLFTGLGAALLLATGHAMAPAYGGIAAQTWILWTYALFGVSGAIWLIVLLPVQIRQARLLRGADVIPADYARLTRLWSISGVAATLAALPAVHLMATRAL